MRAYQTLVNTQAHACKLIMIEGITAFVLPAGADMSANVSISDIISIDFWELTSEKLINKRIHLSDFVGKCNELLL